MAHALSQRSIFPRLLLTGQHPLQAGDFGLDRFDPVSLDCPGNGDPHAHAADVAAGIAARLGDCGLVIVQGDTSSALGGALAARQAKLPLAHVEAGLRSHDRTAPWPEEDFRVAIDTASALLFAPTALSAANLRREAVTGAVHVTGNTAIDALLPMLLPIGRRSVADGARQRLLVTCHRRENWGSGMARIAAALRSIAQSESADIDVVLHPNPAVAGALQALLGNCPGIALHPPMSHESMLERMAGARLILSDSGGMQEEAPAMGVPLLILRDTSERPEAIALGLAELVGTDPDRIVAAVDRHLSAGPASYVPRFPFGDGQASRRIADIISDWLESRMPLANGQPRIIDRRRLRRA